MILVSHFSGTDVVIVKSGRRICGTGGCLANAPLHQNKSYFEFKIQSTGKRLACSSCCPFFFFFTRLIFYGAFLVGVIDTDTVQFLVATPSCDCMLTDGILFALRSERW